MYRFYVVPDATQYSSHSELYANMQLFYDPYAESDIYAVIDPKTKDELNKAGSLEFTVLPSNIHYNDFYKKKSVVIVFDEDTWLYEGVVTDAPVDFYKQRKVSCSGVLTYLCDSSQAPDEKNVIEVPKSSFRIRYAAVPDEWLTGANPKALQWRVQEIQSDGTIEYIKTNDTAVIYGTRYFYSVASDGENYSGNTKVTAAATKETIIAHITRLLNVHNSQVDPFKRIFPGQMYNSSDSETHEFKSSGYRDTWDALKSDILDDFGKYFTITRGNDNNLYLNYLELAQLPSPVIPEIEFTNNMIEISESDNQDDDIFTVLVPIGKDNLTVKDVTGHDTPAHPTHEVSPYIASWGGNKRYVVVSPKAIQRYGHIIKVQQFSDISDKNKLYTTAVNYINNNYDYHAEYEVKAIDMRFISGSGHRILVGDKCHIKSTWHGIDTQELYVISVEHDLANPESDTYRFGIPTSDREANNRTLTGQSQDSKSKNSANQASTSAGMSRMHSILEDYIHVTEWGLEMNTKLKNEVVSNDGKYTTRFIQDEKAINLAAQKLFGVDGEGYGDIDAGYVAVLPENYYDSKGALKNPKNEVWFEKINNKYQLSNDTEANTSKQYYIQRLWTRYSDLEVGEGGIKARVDGNYERSTYCSSWIDINEDSILALTGHLYVDEEGHVHVTSGSGLRTDHNEENTTPTYIQVQRSTYSQNPSPLGKHWYERKLDKTGAWPGQGAADQATNDDYYRSSVDITVDRSKYYYYKSNVREEFVSEFGVYDEDNLVGGVISRLVNNPTYHKVDRLEVRELQASQGSPAAQGWYEYNEPTGTFGLTLDTKVKGLDKYYYVVNNNQVYTDIWGEHIVIGRTVNYSGMDPDLKTRVERYLSHNNRIDGTVTEIASDVVVVNTLIAKYIETDDIVANTSMATDLLQCNDIYCYNSIQMLDGDNETNITCGGVSTNLIIVDNIDILMGLSIDGVQFGSSAEDGQDAGDIIMGFGTITTDGDTVTIPYLLASDNGTYDENHVLSFEKPASIGHATWSSGSGNTHDLKIYTVGGWNGGRSPQWTFYHAVITYPTNYISGTLDSSNNSLITYARKGSDVGTGNSSPLKDTPTIKAHMELYGEDYDKDGNNVGLFHDNVADDNSVIPGWSKYIYIDASDAYNDGYDQGETDVKARAMLDGPDRQTQGADTELWGRIQGLASSTGYDSYYRYRMEDGGVSFGDPAYFKTPSKGSLRTYAKKGNTEYTSGTITLDYDDSVTVYGQRKMDGDSNFESSLVGITVKSKSDNSTNITKSNIDLGNVVNHLSTKPSADKDLTTLPNTYYNADDGDWITFDVSIIVDGSTIAKKTYRMQV